VAMKVNKEVSEDSSSTWPYFVGAAKWDIWRAAAFLNFPPSLM
jgi:hypothetical protein